ncbi:MAG TPA: methyltransferase domain-containing protein [Gammaproteobacteria bacterium]|nr:methyltransferase domain-containing protein [Xanthomonadales bacterium]HOP22650.1 methyltransferase domain-containing protein [Gammaproteobacteria bacterium]HPI96566.1 methyltransferase domain-containing protein [Gammaproteobacteria bacterium]HPQ87950.1 methyltransferase domain-containing protein [Gammaproteobacteria bacterium]
MMKNTHWTDYWVKGYVTSLPEDFKSNYDGELLDFWRNAFSKVPKNARVLDICTGNGAVALLAQEYSDEKNNHWKIDAIDLAEINPKEVLYKNHTKVETSLINFIGGCSIEDYSVNENDKYDFITSQYGVEYCDLPKAVFNISKILKDGRKIGIVSHSPESDMLKNMIRENKDYGLINRLGFFEIIKSFAKGNDSVKSFKLKIMRLTNALTTRNVNSPLINDIVTNLYIIGNMPTKQLFLNRKKLKEYSESLNNAQLRMRDMLQVSKKISDKSGFVDIFQRNSLKLIEDGVINYKNKHHAGDYYIFEKQE